MGKLNLSMRVCGVFFLLAATAAALPAQTFTTLHSFSGTDGTHPNAGLVQATNGYLYGTTTFGGGGADAQGTVFRITPSGTLTTLHSFDGTDGSMLYTAVVQGKNGDFYGTTQAGGVGAACEQADGCGTVFRITPGGTLTTLYNFCSQSNCADGSYINAGLVQATNGDFYGTTSGGGASSKCGDGCGTVFKITQSGTLTTVYNFCSRSNCTDGTNPDAGLVLGTDGNLYGTTQGGGAGTACSQSGGCGTVFKITPTGMLTTLHSFDFADGKWPTMLVQATNGNFYGTTVYGGASPCYEGCGTIFKVAHDGTFASLYSFCSQGGINCSDGAEPFAGLVQATDGNFYGTTSEGGADNACTIDGFNDCGTVFKITPTGTLTTLHSFDCTDGANAYSPVVQATNGKLYGTTFHGGAGDEGTVFSLSVGLAPFVETNPTSGKVGVPVRILGTNLTGVTSVTFNGTPAAFTIVSKTLLKATVPDGATTGTVDVIGPNHTLSSNVPFQVTP